MLEYGVLALAIFIVNYCLTESMCLPIHGHTICLEAIMACFSDTHICLIPAMLHITIF